MFVQQVVILRYIPVVKVGDPKIEKNIKKKRKIEYRKIKAIFTGSCNILHRPVNAKNPEWLNQQIKEKQKSKISDKFAFHVLYLRISR